MLKLRSNVIKMSFNDLAEITQKKPNTIAVFFHRNHLSLNSKEDIRFYLDYIKSGKRIEKGKRKTKHLKKYQFQRDESRIQKARELIRNRRLIWHVANPNKLSENLIVEYILAYGDWVDFLELLKLFGKRRVKEIFAKQTTKKRNNYKPQIINFFNHYFALN